MRLRLASFALFALLFAPLACNQEPEQRDPPPTGCTLDTQCKGDRVCGESGRCVAPDTNPDDDTGVDPDGSQNTDAGMSDSSMGDDTGGMNQDGGGDTSMPDCDPALDPDKDGLDNCEEAQFGTNPNKADTDGDGVKDGSEVFGTPETDPNKADTDGDGLSDGKEIKDTKTDPSKKDSDGDGLGDGKEVNDTMTDPTEKDTDRDGLSDGEEVDNYGSDPNKKDTDGDGIEDGKEVNDHGSDPTKTDTDGDGLADDSEINDHGTDPAKSDTDGDGLSDSDELNKHNTAPTKADSDSDNLDDGEELKNMTDPNAPDSDRDGLLDGDEVKVDMTDPTKSDTDSDGLSDGEELKHNADPLKPDTDGDGLSDAEEVNDHSTDPTKKDTDMDGLSDPDEITVGLDPNKASTYGDGIQDGNRQWVKACLSGGGTMPRGQGTVHTNQTGDWAYYVPTNFGRFRPLKFASPPSGAATAVFYAKSASTYGFVLSEIAQGSPQKTARANLQAMFTTLGNQGSIAQDWRSAAFDTHDGHSAARGHALVTLGTSVRTGDFRNDVLTAASPFTTASATNMPSNLGNSYTQFRVEVTVVDRGTRHVTLFAVTANSNWSNKATKSAMRDATAPSALTGASATRTGRCRGYQPQSSRQPVEFYWVLDQTGSMQQYTNKVTGFAQGLVTKLDKLGLNWRMGVTNMDKTNGGSLFTGDWIAPSPSANTEFSSDIQNGVNNCRSASPPSWKCSGAEEYGLVSARSGLQLMLGLGQNQPTPKEAIRMGADVATIFMTDEEANVVKTDGKTVGPFETFFPMHSAVFSIIGDGGNCGVDDPTGYRTVAAASGGATSSLCANSIVETVERIIEVMAGKASRYSFPLKNPPIPSTLEVRVGGKVVSRGFPDGWKWVPSERAIIFHGKAVPTLSQMMISGDAVNVTYDTYQ